ncbi:hypothetical protein [Amycolatopsis sp. CA-128772]|nr:hypothetical protein [Amycolatopsis sp. CA-128772]
MKRFPPMFPRSADGLGQGFVKLHPSCARCRPELRVLLHGHFKFDLVGG